jgi:hypothetical protein
MAMVLANRVVDRREAIQDEALCSAILGSIISRRWLAYQAAAARDIGQKDRCQPAFNRRLRERRRFQAQHRAHPQRRRPLAPTLISGAPRPPSSARAAGVKKLSPSRRENAGDHDYIAPQRH